MSVLLEVNHLQKYFHTKSGTLHAVENVSFQLEEGKTLGVVGESGCGKSTLGRVILHLLPATGGKTSSRARCLQALPRQSCTSCAGMQMVFQDPFSSINPRMTVSQIIGEPLEIYKLCKSKE